MIIKKIVYVQPFLFDEQQMTNEILIWSVYLDNFLKSRIKYLKSALLYLPIEMQNSQHKIRDFQDKEKFFSFMADILLRKDIKIDQSTIICISCTSSHHYLPSLMIINFFNENYPECILVIGGAHISACPEDYILNGPSVDYIIKGEGELSLYNLMIRNTKKRAIPLIIENVPILDLNEFPPLDLSIFDAYIDHFDALSITLSRGCPFQCSFCMEHFLRENLKVKLWRAYSPKRALEEVNEMISYGHAHDIHEFGFYDPTFGLQKSWLEKFISSFNLNMEKGWIETRIDVLNISLLEKLKEKNFLMWYGIESFSSDLLEIMNKAHDPHLFLKTFNKIYDFHVKNNYYFNMNILCGHPGETRVSYDKTFDRLNNMVSKGEITLNQLSIRYYHSFPGTNVYNQRKSYKEKYGSELLIDKWWKEQKLLKYGPLCAKPSRDLTIHDSFNIYTNKYKQLLSEAKNKIKDDNIPNKLPFLINLKNQDVMLDKRRKEFFIFLEEQGIEMESQYSTIIH